MLGHLRATFSLLLSNVRRSLMLQRLRLIDILCPSDLHCLIQLVLNDLSGRGFHIIERDRRLFRGALGLKSLALRRQIVLCSRRKGLSHVSVPLVFLVYQVIGRCYVVVTVSLEASNRVLLLKLEVIDESLEQFACVGHLLEAREKARLTSLGQGVLLGSSHVRMVPNLRDPDTGLGVRVQNLCDDVFALGGEELWHCVISGHDLLVEIGCLGVLKGQVAGDHSVENDAA